MRLLLLMLRIVPYESISFRWLIVLQHLSRIIRYRKEDIHTSVTHHRAQRPQRNDTLCCTGESPDALLMIRHVPRLSIRVGTRGRRCADGGELQICTPLQDLGKRASRHSASRWPLWAWPVIAGMMAALCADQLFALGEATQSKSSTCCLPESQASRRELECFALAHHNQVISL